VADDDDVDMNLFLTVAMEAKSAMLVDIFAGRLSMVPRRAQAGVNFCLPHGG